MTALKIRLMLLGINIKYLLCVGRLKYRLKFSKTYILKNCIAGRNEEEGERKT